MWIQLNASQVEALKELLPRIGQPEQHKAPIHELLEKIDEEEAADCNAVLQNYVDEARKQYQKDGECEIDDDAVVSHGADSGAYVMAWVWVYDKETRDGDDEEGSGEK